MDQALPQKCLDLFVYCLNVLIGLAPQLLAERALFSDVYPVLHEVGTPQVVLCLGEVVGLPAKYSSQDVATSNGDGQI